MQLAHTSQHLLTWNRTIVCRTEIRVRALIKFPAVCAPATAREAPRAARRHRNCSVVSSSACNHGKRKDNIYCSSCANRVANALHALYEPNQLPNRLGPGTTAAPLNAASGSSAAKQLSVCQLTLHSPTLLYPPVQAARF